MINKKIIYIISFVVLFSVVSFLLFASESSDAYSNFDGKISEFNVTVYNWGFNPRVIEVEEGSLVVLNLETIEGKHGINLYDFGALKYLKEGTTSTLKFIANKKGEFEFFCTVYCGNGHANMAGKLIVK